LTRSGLASSLGVGLATVCGWEDGEVPLYCVPYVELRQLALALNPADPETSAVLNYLLIAGQFDLLVSEMLAGSADYADLPSIGADTVRGVVARDLLAWGFLGIVPDRYREFVRPGCLYCRADRRRIIATLDGLRVGASSELAEYAASLLAMLGSEDQVVRSRRRRGLRRPDRSAGWWFRRGAR
jgi:hypothetical protein